MDEHEYMMWLSSLSADIGAARLNWLLSVFGKAQEVYKASDKSLMEDGGLTGVGLASLLKSRKSCYIDELRKKCDSLGVLFISGDSEEFPSLLKDIPNAPIGLFCLGKMPPEDSPKVAVIGSRRCSEYGLIASRLVAKPLAEAGTVIVSGMAKGIDSMAHRGALQGGGKTVAVLGTGVDICYPAENRNLRQDIISNGCIVSEYPPGAEAKRHFFPQRNRIISGMSLGVIVVEASKKSGTLGTVNHATDQGREVFAVPGNISSKLSEGTNSLIRDGAHPVQDYSDVLYVLGLMPPPGQEPDIDQRNLPLAPEEKLVYEYLNHEPISYDTLYERTGLSCGRLHFVLTGLEVKGHLIKLPAGRYVKA